MAPAEIEANSSFGGLRRRFLPASERKQQRATDSETEGCIQNATQHREQPVSGQCPYPDVWGIENAYPIFDLKDGGIPPVSREFALRTLRSHLDRQKNLFMGYQSNLNLHFSAEFAHYLDITLNNVGDPFVEGNSTPNTKFMERAVLDYYARLWHACYPHNPKNPESYWGCCLTMGSTEGNLYAMWNARDYLSGKRIVNPKLAQHSTRRRQQSSIQAPTPEENPNAFTPVAFYSADAHYSVGKAMAMLSIRTFYEEGEIRFPGQCPLLDGQWPAEVPSLETGAIDVHALADLVEFFASRGYPIIVCFSYGTTFKGAYDDVGAACKKLKPILQKHGLLERQVHYSCSSDEAVFDTRTGFWFHSDGALGAAYMPFVEMAYKRGLMAERGPLFDFTLEMVHSIVMSGHKWMGAPMPCGVYMSKVKYQMLPSQSVEYIGAPDTTFAGSRSGLAPMLLWDNIARHSISDQIKKVLKLLQLAEYAETRLRQLQNDILKTDLYVARSPLSLAIRFKCPNMDLCKKYSLPTQTSHDGRCYARIFSMDHITTYLINNLIQDLSQNGAFS